MWEYVDWKEKVTLLKNNITVENQLLDHKEVSVKGSILKITVCMSFPTSLCVVTFEYTTLKLYQ